MGVNLTISLQSMNKHEINSKMELLDNKITELKNVFSEHTVNHKKLNEDG